MTNEEQIDEMYHLLTENYVEDDDNSFRFDYSRPFLRWALMVPGYVPDWHVGVRTTGTNKLLGFVTAVPATILVGVSQAVPMVEINFLCVHKKLRSKRLAPVLIKEVTRRVNMRNVWQAVYTAGVVLPRPVAECRYYHRNLQPKKLVETGFSGISPRMTMQRMIKLYKLPDELEYSFRPIEQKDVPQVTDILNEYLLQFRIRQKFTCEEVAHALQFLPNVVYCYVYCANGGSEVTDFFSFYSLPSSVLGKGKHSSIYAAYAYYSVGVTLDKVKLQQQALIAAKNLGFDVFNCLDMMCNESFLKELKFGPGDGKLQYYLYNYMCPHTPQSLVGLILL
eukprot:GHVR01147601.1.p1 GENE.GHVR01147601.1~~GHVR01147601.1.p1  ORF type:complete len:336 (+),score=50.46 GHVR01147601.1:151-1158(+)